MAAVLCKGIGSLFGGCCDAIGTVCKTVFTGPCKLCAHSCTACADLCKSPFSGFVVIAFLAQIPPIVVGLKELPGIADSCTSSLWLIGAIAFGVVHISASIYMALQIQNRNDPNLQHLNTAFSRASYLLCHDPWMAMYILVWIAFVVWLGYGSFSNWAGEFDDDQKDDTCSTEDSVNIALGCGWFFTFAGPVVLAMSVCCAFCDKRDYGAQTTYLASPDIEQGNAQPPAAATTTTTATPSTYETFVVQEQKQQQASEEPFETAYTADGVPAKKDSTTETTAHEEFDAPVALAEVVPMTPPSAPPAAYENSSSRGEPKTTDESQAGSQKAAAVGSKVGKKLGKLFNLDSSKQQNLEKKGQAAGEAVGKGYANTKDYIQSKVY